MKQKLLITIIAFQFFNLQLFSQDNVFKPFKVDFGLRYDISTDDETGSGFGIFIEPRYGVNENFTMGLKLQSDFFTPDNMEINLTSVNINISRIFSMLITGEYYFSTEDVRPFIGFGMGMYKRHIDGVSVSLTDVNVDTTSKTYFGFEPRIGINIKHFRILAFYNYTGEGINNYVGIQIGLEIGGSRIN